MTEYDYELAYKAGKFKGKKGKGKPFSGGFQSGKGAGKSGPGFGHPRPQKGGAPSPDIMGMPQNQQQNRGKANLSQDEALVLQASTQDQ